MNRAGTFARVSIRFRGRSIFEADVQLDASLRSLPLESIMLDAIQLALQAAVIANEAHVIQIEARRCDPFAELP